MNEVITSHKNFDMHTCFTSKLKRKIIQEIDFKIFNSHTYGRCKYGMI